MCTVKNTELELVKSKNDALRTNVKSKKKNAKYLTEPSMQTYLNGIPTQEEVIKFLTTLQWPEERTYLFLL
jgi:hypothetical protein